MIQNAYLARKCHRVAFAGEKKILSFHYIGLDLSLFNFLFMLNYTMESYVIGIELMEKLRISQIELYEQVIELEQTYKREVEIRTKVNTDSSINQQLFFEILEKFQVVLEKEFPYLTRSSIGE